MRRGVCIVVFLLLAFEMAVQAQSLADKLFERGDYLEALNLYQKELEKTGDNNQTAADLIRIKIANCLFFLNDVVRAGLVYKKVNPDLLGAEELTYYAVTLVHAGDYDKALEEIDMAESLGADDVLTSRIKASCEFAKEVAKEKPVYAATKTKVDFSGISAGVTYYKGKGIILAAPGMGDNAVKDSRGYKVTRLYNAIFTGDGTSGRMMPFANELADKYHIGAVTFSKDFKRIYYTRTILKKDGTSILKLMTAEEEDGKWGNIQELDINSDDYSCAHPCLYKDSLLFFVSDMPGGVGGKDVYMTVVDGPECGEIVNLGETVNTIFDELYPFVAEDGKLYFASNGHVGLGGLDVFVSEWLPDGTWSEPLNMGRPINSSMDDFALVFKDTTCKEGYVSSNRGGTGYNDFLFSLRMLPSQKKVARLAAKQPKLEEVVKEEKIEKVIEESPVDYRYAIQVGAFRNPVPRVYWENFKNIKVYLGYDNIYRYTTGEYPDEQLARMELPQVRRQVHDAFVMSVEKYVKERKIQHGIKGDQISDEELLLIRLKNLEKNRSLQKQKTKSSARRYLDRPCYNELQQADPGYTIVLMSADRVFDPLVMKGITDVTICAVAGGKYMYCSGVYKTWDDANRCLCQIKSKGFADAYVIHRNNDVFYKGSSTPTYKPRNVSDLRMLLNF